MQEHRKSLRRRACNRMNRTRMRSAVKLFRGLLAAGDVDAARKSLPTTLGLIDRTSRLGAIHDRAAARTKSRLARALNRVAAG
jgi:small subunit ribosomal protein S20